MVRRHPTSELIASKVAEHDVPPHCRAVHPDLLNLARRLRRGFRLLCGHHADQTLHTGWVHRMEDVYQVVFPRNAERLCRAEFRSVDIHPSTANVACRHRGALSRLAIAIPSKQYEQYEPKWFVSAAGTSRRQVSSLRIHCCLQRAVQQHQKLTLSKR